MPGARALPFDGQTDEFRAPEDAEQPIWPRLRVYLSGAQVGGVLHAPDGTRLGEGKFKVQEYVGSGFAGQVYRVDVEAGTRAVLGTGDPVALKILRPAGRGKLWFRDFLFLLSYQMTFAARLRAPAVRAGQLLNLIIQDAVVREGGAVEMVANPRGYFWDAELRSFVEIYDWEMGRPQRYTPDDQLIQRWLNPNAATSPDEMYRKRTFMSWLVSVCDRLGAEGVARQYAWDTWISQANVLTRLESTGTAEFVAIDWRPGLAVPFFMPLSPAHARLILHGLRRGRWVLFDQLDVMQLQDFTAGLKQPVKTLAEQVGQLLENDQKDRAARPDLWQAGDALLTDRNRRLVVQEGLVSDWQRLGRISAERAAGLQHHRMRFWIHFLLSLLPWLGSWLQSVLDHPSYRSHTRAWLSDRDYRKAYQEALRARDLAEWVWFERVTQERANSLETSNFVYLAHKLGLSWLPPALHRLATDPMHRREWMQNIFVLPIRLILDEATRLAWLARVLQVQVERGALSEAEAEVALRRMRTPRLRGFARDLGFSAGLEVFSRLFYILLAIYGAAMGSFWPLLVAMLGPVSPSGVIRFLYIGRQLVSESLHIWRERNLKLLAARLSGMLLAPWRFVGNFCVPVELFAYEPQVSLLVAEYLVYQLVRLIPVFGGRNKLLEYITFQLTYNLPLSLRHTLLTGVCRLAGSRDRPS